VTQPEFLDSGNFQVSGKARYTELDLIPLLWYGHSDFIRISNVIIGLLLIGERLMDDDAFIAISGLVCPECSVVVHCDYSRLYLREKALVDGEVEVIHHCEDKDNVTVGLHMNTVKLHTAQLDRIRDVLARG